MEKTKVEGGYSHPAYAEALSEFGRPRALSQSGGWLLEREIPGTNAHDATGCYPIFSCRDWSLLNSDLKEVGESLVSLVIVTDPFGAYSQKTLRKTFPALVTPYKEHFIVKLNSDVDLQSFVHKHHQRNVHKGLESLEVTHAPNPGDWSDEWCILYERLINRHSISSIAQFSHASFEKQLRVPGMQLFRATRHGQAVGITLWFVGGEDAYYHLAAYDDLGYSFCASFALFWRALEYFRKAGIRRVALGAGAGAAVKDDDGLTRFKQGWANCTQTVYLCGRIFDRERYTALALKRRSVYNYFPVYRAGNVS